MLLASCAKDEAAVTSGEALVTFNVAASQIGSRAYGDGVTANDLEYAIYEKGSYAQPLIAKSIDDAFADDAMSTTFSEKLVKGKTYIALFWADAENDPYEIDWTKQTVKIANPAALKAQDENLDAFFKAHEIAVGQEAQTETVELTRPFAQLNIGTSDTADARTAGLVVEKTEVSVRAYTTLNLLNGEVADAMQLTYAMDEIPSGENATFTVKEKTYDHLSMNYLLVNQKELVTVDFTVNDGTSNINKSTFAQVPVERNYKTFIVGELLTSAVDFEVIIIPDNWKNPDYIWPDENGGDNGEGGDDNGEGGDDEGDNEGGNDQPTTPTIDLAGNWSADYKYASATNAKINTNHLANPAFTFVKLASENGKNPKNGQKYYAQYKRFTDQDIYFDIDTNEIAGKPGCYAIINLIDREGAQDKITNNNSYYDSVNDILYIDFVTESNGAPGVGGASLDSYTVAGYLWTAKMTR